MKGDFSRDTFDAAKHFLRVLMQQGRVQLDADWNEQAAIFLHYLQNLAKDLIGPHGGPENNFGFGITWVDTKADFKIGKGHYYVDGILCENEKEELYYTEQGDWPGASKLDTSKINLVYLDVWERHITIIEDPDIREKALGGPDTAMRTKVLWQVKTWILTSGTACTSMNPDWSDLIKQWQPANRGLLKAQGKQPLTEEKNPCTISPEARFRGAENQLYRVEIHSDGVAEGATGLTKATFKWSRDNGSVVYPITKMEITQSGNITTATITLQHFGQETRFEPSVGDWVEILDDDYVLQVGSGSTRAVENLFKIITTNKADRQVVLEGKPDSTVGQDLLKHPFLLRWDHKGGDPQKGGLPIASNGALPLKENEWLPLEDGVQIMFESGSPDHLYRRSDYWLIPARASTGDVEWPTQEVITGNSKQIVPIALEPNGVEHHYAPLAIIEPIGKEPRTTNCRSQFSLNISIPLTEKKSILAEPLAATSATKSKSRSKSKTSGSGK